MRHTRDARYGIMDHDGNTGPESYGLEDVPSMPGRCQLTDPKKNGSHSAHRDRIDQLFSHAFDRAYHVHTADCTGLPRHSVHH